LLILADEVYGDLGFDGPVEPLGILDPDAGSFRTPVSVCTCAGLADRWMAIGNAGWTPSRPR
jgi:hypothetical protein